ncbi:MAG: LysR family transcriptional regulator [Chloroflexi bacterium]|nr:MAG: LysR family transcriptional regulator [Chloroflexota bacterium]TMF18552.1 MAG: LysR family transcriptional regulator [Chloroflexota bacterium]TMF98268.1 MAG: LysR family transcriptional regulator [Chloroflexota bacterium]
MQRLVAALAVLVDLLLRDGCSLPLRGLDSLEARRGAADRRKRTRLAGGHSAYIVGAVPKASARLDLDRAVTLRQLRTFKTVADLTSFSAAAQRLKLSQPSVSYQVKELEETLGLPLLDRLGKRVQLTEAGNVLYNYARRMLDVLDEATVVIEEMRGIQRGTLRVGASTTVGIYLLPAALGAFKKLHPGLVISLEIGTRARVQDQVLRNELDLAVVGPALKDPELAIIPFLSDELAVVAPAGHPLAGRRGLTLKDLADQPFIMREASSGSRLSLEKAARKAGAKLRVAMELGSNGAIKHAVESGLGLAVISRYATALEFSSGRLVELDVRGFPIRRDWHIVHLRRRKLPASVHAFIDFLKDTSWLSRNGSRGRVRPPTD